jgi:hypothetical protein
VRRRVRIVASAFEVEVESEGEGGISERDFMAVVTTLDHVHRLDNGELERELEGVRSRATTQCFEAQARAEARSLRMPDA